MRHEVPQFIDIQDKIFFGLTFIQSLYLVGGFFGAFAVYYFTGKVWVGAPIFIKASFALPIFVLGLALAFLEINKRPFIKYLEALFYFTISPKKYIWRKQDRKENHKIDKQEDDFILAGETRNYTIQNQDYVRGQNKRSRLKSLAHNLDMEV